MGAELSKSDNSAGTGRRSLRGIARPGFSVSTPTRPVLKTHEVHPGPALFGIQTLPAKETLWSHKALMTGAHSWQRKWFPSLTMQVSQMPLNPRG